jgi:microcystin-dependent protein
MAGLGARLFPAFSKLTSEQVNGYLMSQSMMRFANATARDAAFGGVGELTLAEGMFCYLDDLNVVRFYNGSNWVGLTPTGSLVPFAGTTAPTGWLLCSNVAVSRSTYADLFGVVGTTYGAGDGTTTFNVPDLRGRVIAGLDNMGGTTASRLTATTITGGADAVGEVGGSQTHTLSVGEMPQHTHTQNDFGLAPSTAGYPTANGFLNGGAGANGQGGARGLGLTGGSAAHNNVQPTMTLNYLIAV